MPYKKLKLYPTPMVCIWKGYIIQECFRLQNIFLKMATNLILKTGVILIFRYSGDETYATENPSASLPGIDFLGTYKIINLSADNLPYRKLVSPKPDTHPQRQRV